MSRVWLGCAHGDPRIVAALRLQARACADHGSPMYGDLLRAGRRRRRGRWSGRRGARVLRRARTRSPTRSALRLLGSVHRLVLERRAGELAPFYPSVGGTWEAEAGWAAFRRPRGRATRRGRGVAGPPAPDQRGRTRRCPVRRAAAPADGSCPVRLVEIGASGGLNLRADRFAYLDAAGRRLSVTVVRRTARAGVAGPARSTAVAGPRGGRAAGLRPAAGRRHHHRRAGCADRVRLGRHAGPLRAAAARFEVAARVPVDVRGQERRRLPRPASSWRGARPRWCGTRWCGSTSPRASRRGPTARLEELGAASDRPRRFAHVAVEPARRHPRAGVPGGAAHLAGG